jgi:hypothetical protein
MSLLALNSASLVMQALDIAVLCDLCIDVVLVYCCGPSARYACYRRDCTLVLLY